MKKSIQLITVLINFTLGATAIQATTNYWDINSDTAGAGGSTPSGTWDTGATANWTTDSTGASAGTTFADNDDAIFSAGSDATGTFAIGLSGTPVVGNLTVEEGAITISGGTALNIGGGVALKGNIDVLPNSMLTINSVITGGDNSASITKGIFGGTGTGTLVLSGANTFNGQVTVRVGTLSFDSIGNVNGGPSALGNPTDAALGTIKVGGGAVAGTLKYTGTGHSTDRVINMAGTTGGATNDASGSGAIIFTSPIGVTATANNNKMFELTGTSTADNTISGPIVNPASGYVRLQKTGIGTWVLNGLSTYTGVTDIREGTLVVNSLANKNTASSIGTGNAGAGHDIIGLGGYDSTNATLKYTGTGHSSSRPIYLWGLTIGGGTIDASGTGPLVLRGEIRRPGNETATELKVLTLKGTNTGTNTISGQISDAVTGGKTSVSKDGVGKWVLSGPNAYTGATTVNGGTLLVNGLGSLAAGSVVSVGPGATLGGKGTINGPVTVAATGTLSPGASVGNLTLNSDLTLSGDLLIEVDKSLSPSNDVVTVAGALTNAGTGKVMFTNLGAALAAGDTFFLFTDASFNTRPLPNGQALAIVSSGGEVWTNKLAVDGSIAVVSVPTPKVPATNLTIAAVGPSSVSLGGLGASNSPYGVYASTNVMLPMTNWWLIGTTNSSADGVIQFLDPQATNGQRFYRFGQ